MATARTKVWNDRVIRYLENYPQRVFNARDLSIFLDRTRDELGIPKNLSTPRFAEFLKSTGKLSEVDITPAPSRKHEPAAHYRRYKRFIWEGATPEAVALSLRPGSYLSHASAVFHHNLTLQIPKTIYVNKEQTPKASLSNNSLSQETIDRAFRNAPRVSNYIYRYDEFRIVLLSGKNTRRLEVTDLKLPSGDFVPVTKLERTLIDIVVRPTYAGGVFEVLEAYKSAQARMSVSVLLATLRKLDYIYPYRQAIGFYMQRAGYSTEQLSRLKALGMTFDFYLAHKISDPKYDPDWKVYYPEGL